MIAHYGYQDAEGEFYITIATDRCNRCDARPCIAACPRALFVAEEDPYGGFAVAVDAAKRRKLKYECAACKPVRRRAALPCVTACPLDALTHSW